MKKKAKSPNTIRNRRARHDYALDNSLIVGIALTGAETKALRMGHGHLQGAYVTLKNGELWLLNATITGTPNIRLDEQEQTRSRKLLAKQKEIESLARAKEQGRTIVPLEILTRGRFIKVRIATGRGQKLYDKRQVLKERDEDRRIRTALKRV